MKYNYYLRNAGYALLIIVLPLLIYFFKLNDSLTVAPDYNTVYPIGFNEARFHVLEKGMSREEIVQLL